MRYQSTATVGDTPVVSIAFGPDSKSQQLRGRAIGVIAVGDVAVGIIAVGAIAAGVIAIGGLGLGVIGVGGLALGLVALGGLAIGGGSCRWSCGRSALSRRLGHRPASAGRHRHQVAMS
jgi:hypothetical protein